MNPAQIPVTFGSWVRTRRRTLDLTQAELGQRAGCSAAAIRKIEADERKPSQQLAVLLAQALEISTDEQTQFLQMARGKFIDPGRAEAASQSPVSVIPAHNIPAPLTALIDRHHDLKIISAMLTDPAIRLVTLIGPPGIGKTRLSMQSGLNVLPVFRDGVWFVDLSSIEQADFLFPAIIRMLEICEIPPGSGLSQLISNLREKNLLLILDNFEQIVENAALEVAQLLRSCPGVKALITSRVPLHIYGEHEYAIPSLSIPPIEASAQPERLLQYEAVQLFLARVRQHQPDFSVNAQNAAAIIKVCQQLEGIPLALELAAATLHSMPLDEMHTLLQAGAGSGWIRQLATPARDLPARQRTLENVIAWSYSLLENPERDFFNRLGILSGWFDAEAASVLFQDETQTRPGQSLQWLEHLNNHSLLVRGNFGGKPYFRMLEIIHDFAAFQLTPQLQAELERLRCCFFMNCLQTVEHPYPADFQLHAENFHAALRWAIAAEESELAYQLAQSLFDFWNTYGYLREGLGLMQRVIVLPGQIDPELRVGMVSESADLAWQQYDFDTAVRLSEMAVHLAQELGLSDLYPEYCNRLGRIYLEQGKYAEAAHSLGESLIHLPEAGRPMAQLGELAWFEGRLDEAKETLQLALVRLPESDRIFRAMALTDLAEVALVQRDFENCRVRLQQAAAPAEVNTRRVMVFLSALAGYLLHQPASDPDEWQSAACFLGAVEALSEQSGVHLSNFYQRVNQQRRDLARQRLSASQWQSAQENGHGWNKDRALAEAKKVLSFQERL